MNGKRTEKVNQPLHGAGQAAKKEYAISAYLDDEFPEDISIYLVQELLGDGNYRIGGNVIKANARMGWYPNAYKFLGSLAYVKYVSCSWVS